LAATPFWRCKYCNLALKLKGAKIVFPHAHDLCSRIHMIEVSSISRNHFHNANKEALKLIIAFDKKLRANLTFINLHID
jgi:hypothetical protein